VSKDSRRVIAEDRSAMSMMEYSGDLGGVGGGFHWFRMCSFSSRRANLRERGVRWAAMSAGDGSSVRRTMAVDTSWV
jgi:hypothetical protein